jgi:hypothetical protein
MEEEQEGSVSTLVWIVGAIAILIVICFILFLK